MQKFEDPTQQLFALHSLEELDAMARKLRKDSIRKQNALTERLKQMYPTVLSAFEHMEHLDIGSKKYLDLAKELFQNSHEVEEIIPKNVEKSDLEHIFDGICSLSNNEFVDAAKSFESVKSEHRGTIERYKRHFAIRYAKHILKKERFDPKVQEYVGVDMEEMLLIAAKETNDVESAIEICELHGATPLFLQYLDELLELKIKEFNFDEIPEFHIQNKVIEEKVLNWKLKLLEKQQRKRVSMFFQAIQNLEIENSKNLYSKLNVDNYFAKSLNSFVENLKSTRETIQIIILDCLSVILKNKEFQIESQKLILIWVKEHLKLNDLLIIQLSPPPSKNLIFVLYQVFQDAEEIVMYPQILDFFSKCVFEEISNLKLSKTDLGFAALVCNQPFEYTKDALEEYSRMSVFLSPHDSKTVEVNTASFVFHEGFKYKQNELETRRKKDKELLWGELKSLMFSEEGESVISALSQEY